MATRFLVLSALLALPLFPGCNGGFDTEEATAWCERLEQGQEACFNDDVMAACVACHEECGRSCKQLERCPLDFICE